MTRTVLIFIAVLLAVLPVAAQESPRFFIERIEVRNAKRVSTDVVVAESRLSPGREYSEAELRDASTRLSRLPFLVSVDFSLEKGSERGKHVLVLSIVETKPFFYLLDLRALQTGSGDSYAQPDYGDALNDQGASVLGFRWFVGRRGSVHAGLQSTTDLLDFTSDFAALTVGYTQYDLFGTRAFATLSLKRPLQGFAEGSITPQIVVGVPLSPNQTLTLQADRTQWSRNTWIFDPACMDDPQACGRGEVRFGQRVLSARWSYNTTNSPFVPTRGTVLSVAPTYAHTDVRGRTRVYTFDPETGEQTAIATPTEHGDAFGIETSAQRFWELSERNSVSAGVDAAFSRINSRYDEEWDFPEATQSGHTAIVRSKFIHSLWSQERRREGDSLLEVTASYALRRYINERYNFNGYDETFDARQISAAWVRRSSWGTLRLGAGYAW